MPSRRAGMNLSALIWRYSSGDQRRALTFRVADTIAATPFWANRSSKFFQALLTVPS